MKRPVVGVIGSAHIVENRFAAQRAGERNLMAVHDVVGALPLIFAGDPALTDIDALLDAVDGVLLTGARANVHLGGRDYLLQQLWIPGGRAGVCALDASAAAIAAANAS